MTVRRGKSPVVVKAVPSGIDYLVSLAARDPRFRARLLADRLKAARRAGLRLTDSERAVLLAIPERQLAATIDGVQLPSAARRGFLRSAALWAAGLFGGVTMTTMTGCPLFATKGATPDEPAPPRKAPADPPRPDEDEGERDE